MTMELADRSTSRDGTGLTLIEGCSWCKIMPTSICSVCVVLGFLSLSAMQAGWLAALIGMDKASRQVPLPREDMGVGHCPLPQLSRSRRLTVNGAIFGGVKRSVKVGAKVGRAAS